MQSSLVILQFLLVILEFIEFLMSPLGLTAAFSLSLYYYAL